MSGSVPRSRERIGGAVLLALGVWLTLYGWHVVTAQGGFNMAGSVMGPACAVLGAALLAVPGYKSERWARGEDPAALEGWAQLTPRWRVIAGVALALGLLNAAAVRFGAVPDLWP